MTDRTLHPPKGCGPHLSGVGDPRSSLKQRLFEQIRAAGTIARVDMARQLDISPATVTSLTGDLIEQGLIREYAAQREASRGRPRVALGVVPESHLVVGLKLSDREHTAVLADFTGSVLTSVAVDRQAPFETLDALLQLVETMVDDVCRKAGVTQNALSGLGIGVPGFVEFDHGFVRWSPVFKPRDVSLSHAVAKRLGVPTTLDNDANVATLAELWFGSGRKERDFAVVTIEHGVGMGVVINHRLYRGAKGLGLELGHTKVQMEGALCRCGQRGCLEAYLADYALAREAATALGPAAQTRMDNSQLVTELYEEALRGHEGAKSIFRRAGRYLALGLANISNLFDPARIILSGARMQYDLLYADNVLEEVENMIVNRGKPTPNIDVRAWGELIWARGAAALALDLVCNEILSDKQEVAAE